MNKVFDMKKRNLFIDPDNVFHDPHMKEINSRFIKDIFKVHGYAYQSSISSPGYIEKVHADGRVEIGYFSNGKFIPK